MHFQPRDDRVLVEPLKAESLGTADQSGEKDTLAQGIVKAVGPGALHSDGSGRRVAPGIRVGAHVWYDRTYAEQVTLGSVVYDVVVAGKIVGDRT